MNKFTEGFSMQELSRSTFVEPDEAKLVLHDREADLGPVSKSEEIK